jgi:hypothetical protein
MAGRGQGTIVHDQRVRIVEWAGTVGRRRNHRFEVCFAVEMRDANGRRTRSETFLNDIM